MAKDIFSIRIEKELLTNIEKLNKFLNEEVLKNRMSLNSFIEILAVKGIKVYYEKIKTHCTHEQLEKLASIQKELEEYLLNNFKEGGMKTNKTINIDKYYHELLKAYCLFENNIYNRDWTVNGLIVGTFINGIEFYIRTDKAFIESMHIKTEYNYQCLMEELMIIVKKQGLNMTFKR